MRLLSLNVGLFESNNQKLIPFLQDLDPDFACFQEVTRAWDEKAKPEFVSLPAIQKSLPENVYQFFGPNWFFKYFSKNDFHGKENFNFDLGGMVEFGNLVLSKHKMMSAQNAFLQNNYSLVVDWSNWPKEDYKAVISTEIILGSSPLRIINYHGLWSQDKQDSRETIEASKKISQFAKQDDLPCIICGDFNLFPDTKSIQILKDDFTSLVDIFDIQTTRPADNELAESERNVVDYIFTSQYVHVKDFQVIDSDVSDHLPLLLEFEL